MIRHRETGDIPSLQLEGPQWSFAIDVYQRPGVATACLFLQDVLGADISLLLFVIFSAREHRTAFEQADLDRMDGAIAAWRREVIWPLRSIRRRMKTGPEPAPASATEALVQQIKAAEIHAEQIELAALAQWFDRDPRTPSTVDIPAVLAQVAAFFAARSGNSQTANSPEVRSALMAIADAIAQDTA
jgi:uncharacterized protein (TIGR02444 family)